MAWSDAAREAAAEARRASAKAKKFPSVDAHRTAAETHRVAAGLMRVESTSAAAHHEKMAELHEARVSAHLENPETYRHGVDNLATHGGEHQIARARDASADAEGMTAQARAAQAKYDGARDAQSSHEMPEMEKTQIGIMVGARPTGRMITTPAATPRNDLQLAGHARAASAAHGEAAKMHDLAQRMSPAGSHADYHSLSVKNHKDQAQRYAKLANRHDLAAKMGDVK
jgi:DNA-binding phage protein